MAIRIHVTAVRQRSLPEVKTCFTEILGAGFDQVPLHEHQGWVWFQSSVWGVGADSLRKGLSQLGGPGLQFTTSDGDRWILSVFGADQQPRHFLHEFSQFGYDPDPHRDHDHQEPQPDSLEDVPEELRFLEDDPPPKESQRPWSAFDKVANNYTGMGMPLPDAIRDRVQGMPYSQAVLTFRSWYIEEILAALDGAGIPHERELVRQVLLWKNMTEVERGSDLGNLPRLLSVLGMGAQWDQCVAQAENPPVEESCEVSPEPPPAKTYLSSVHACIDSLALHPIRGESVGLPLKRLSDLAFIPEACAAEESPGVLLRLDLPQAFDPEPFAIPQDPYSRCEIAVLPLGVEIGLENEMMLNWRHLKEQVGKPLARLLRYPPDGAVLECSFGHAKEPEACQRYRGIVREGIWLIGETSPALTETALREALELGYNAEGKKKFTARDEAEADAVMEMVPRDSYLHNMGVRRKDLTILCKYDVGKLAVLFFRHRCRDSWTLHRLHARLEQEYRARLKQAKEMRRSMAQAAKQRSAPHDDEVFHEGCKTRFWRSDFARLETLDQTQREEYDREMTARGYRHLGDMVAKKFRDIVLRCYGSADGLVYALLMGKRAFYMGTECISYFANGARLTTTTNSTVDSHPEIQVYYKHCADLGPGPLEEKHRWGIQRFRTHHGTEPVPLEMSLLGVARALDAAIAQEEARQANNPNHEDD